MLHRFLCILPVFVLLAAISCAPVRHASLSVSNVRDTTHVIVRDTLHVTHVHDSTVVHIAERIHIEENTTFDPSTGHPSSRRMTIDAERDIASLIRHLADSLFFARDSTSVQSTESTELGEALQEPVKGTVTPVRLFFRSAASLLCLMFVIVLVVIAVRFYLRGRNSSCW